MQTTTILAVFIVSAAYAWQCGGQSVPAIVTVIIALVLLLDFQSSKGIVVNGDGDGDSRNGSTTRAFESFPGLTSRGIPDRPHVQGAFEPSTGLLFSNPSKSDEFENARCKGKYIFLHRPTFDKVVEASGDYPHAAHFKGRKRIWENRLQLSFKDVPEGQLYFGIELDEYVHMNAFTKAAMKTIVEFLRKSVGDELYHSVGDDPKSSDGELEKPAFMMPFWAFDQLIVTPEGEEPPSLTDPDFANLGSRRVNRIGAFKNEMEALKFRPGPTYTFAFYGISNSLDNIKWEVKLPLAPAMDFNKLCGQPPVRVVIYTLSGSEDNDKRHLPSRKQYYFNLAFWSSKCPPSKTKFRKLVGDRHLEKLNKPITHKKDGVGSWLFCCTAPRSEH